MYTLVGRSLFLIAVLGIQLFSFISCSKNTMDRANPLDKEVLKLNFTEGDVPSLHPDDLSLIVRGVALSKWIYEGLTRLAPSGEYELAGAEEYTESPCKKIYTFKLRNNSYSNGEPVTAFDYENFWKASLKPTSRSLKVHLLYCIKNAERAKKGEVPIDEVGVKALDAQTLVVELEAPTPHLFKLLALPLFVPFKEKNKLALSNGPYCVTKWQKNDRLLLEANPYFWGHADTRIPKIEIFMIKNASTAFSMYQNGELDWIGDPFCWLPSEIVLAEIAGHRLKKQEGTIYPFWIHLNTTSFPLSSPLVRKALSCVIDREAITSHVLAADDPLLVPTINCSYSKMAAFDSNIELGKRFLDEGMKNLGLTRETFPTLTLSSCDLDNFKKLAAYLQETWQKNLGIKVELDIKDWNTFFSNIATGNYQMGGYYDSADYASPLANLEPLAFRTNYPKWQSEKYKITIEKLKREGDPIIQKKMLQQASDILKDEMPILWLTNKGMHHAYRKDLHGLCFDQRGLPDFRWAYFD